ncbi:hypothetical protein pb186bvf_011501 [Paramecium bursaria]
MDKKEEIKFQRINSDMVPKFVGKEVCIVGRYVSFKNGVLQLQVDKSIVEVVDIDDFPETKQIVELRGKINRKHQLEAEEYAALDDKLDYRAHARTFQKTIL